MAFWGPGLWVVLSAALAAVYHNFTSEMGWTTLAFGVQTLFAAAAWFLLTLLGTLIPGLLPAGRLRAPYFVTLPIAHSAILIALVVLAANVRYGIQQVPYPLDAALAWLQPANTIGMILIAAGFLTVSSLGSK